MVIKLKLNAKAYIYLRRKYGTQIKINKAEALKKYLYNLITRNRGDRKTYRAVVDRYKYHVIIDIPSYLADRDKVKGIYSEATVDFNTHLKSLFDQEFYAAIVIDHFVFKMDIEDAINKFMSDYGIEDTVLSFDALKQSFYRFRVKHDSLKNAVYIKKKAVSDVT